MQKNEYELKKTIIREINSVATVARTTPDDDEAIIKAIALATDGIVTAVTKGGYIHRKDVVAMIEGYFNSLDDYAQHLWEVPVAKVEGGE